MVIGLSRLQFGLQSYERQITSMITDRIGRNEVLLPINHNYNKICDILGFFKVKTQEILRGFFLLALKIKKPFKHACEMVRTVQLQP